MLAPTPNGTVKMVVRNRVDRVVRSSARRTPAAAVANSAADHNQVVIAVTTVLFASKANSQFGSIRIVVQEDLIRRDAKPIPAVSSWPIAASETRPVAARLEPVMQGNIALMPNMAFAARPVSLFVRVPAATARASPTTLVPVPRIRCAVRSRMSCAEVRMSDRFVARQITARHRLPARKSVALTRRCVVKYAATLRRLAIAAAANAALIRAEIPSAGLLVAAMAYAVTSIRRASTVSARIPRALLAKCLVP